MTKLNKTTKLHIVLQSICKYVLYVIITIIILLFYLQGLWTLFASVKQMPGMHIC